MTNTYHSGTWTGSSIITTGSCPWCGALGYLVDAGFGTKTDINSGVITEYNDGTASWKWNP